MEFNTFYNKIQTDESMMETITPALPPNSPFSDSVLDNPAAQD